MVPGNDYSPVVIFGGAIVEGPALLEEFSTNAVARITGVTHRQLDYWANTGFIVPSISAGVGRGKVRLYSFSDLVQVRVAKRLSDAGISLQKMRRAVSTLRSLAPEIAKPLAQFQLVCDGQDVFAVQDEAQMIAVTSQAGQFYWRLKVGEIMQELTGKVKELTSLEQTSVQVQGQKYVVEVCRDLDSKWWIGRCPEVRGCVTQGKDRKELLSMLADAIEECLRPDGRARSSAARA